MDAFKQTMAALHIPAPNGDSMTGAGDFITSMLSRFAIQRKAGDDEFIGPDGLIYCAACRTPRQFPRAIESGATVYLPIVCDCERRALEAEAADEQRKQDARRMERLRGASLMSDKLLAATFDAWESRDAAEDKARRVCARYADRFDDLAAKNQGLLFYGPPGTGKTFAAACIANALLARGVPVLMTSMVRLMAVVNGKDEAEILPTMASAKLMVIDDLGAERDTAYGIEKAYAFIDERYRQARPMIVTTNMALSDIQRDEHIGRRRIYDRVIECCYPVEFIGTSRRKAEARDRFDEMRRVLEL